MFISCFNLRNWFAVLASGSGHKHNFIALTFVVVAVSVSMSILYADIYSLRFFRGIFLVVCSCCFLVAENYIWAEVHFHGRCGG